MAANNMISQLFESKMQGMDITNLASQKRNNSKMTDGFSSFLNQEIKNSDAGYAEKLASAFKSNTKFENSNDSYDRFKGKIGKVYEVESETETVANAATVAGAVVEEGVDSVETKSELELHLEGVSTKLNEFEKTVVKAISEELEVSEEEVVNAMQTLGMTAVDLLNPQNLAGLAVNLTKVADTSALVMDTRFHSLLTKVSDLGNQLMVDLNVNAEQLNELVSLMEEVKNPQQVPTVAVPEGDVSTSDKEGHNPVDGYVVGTGLNYGPSEEHKVQNDTTVNVGNAENTVGNTNETENTEMSGQNQTGANGENSTGLPGMGEGSKDENSIGDSIGQNIPSMGETQATTPVEGTQAPNDSYVSVNTTEIIEQFAEKVKITNFAETSSMQMELNPENLGKLYVNVSSKQGAVNAQIAATNEQVKEALETQVVELKDTLNQAGVKVDSVEVTLATHEFEQNLEQGQTDPQQEQQSQSETVDASSVEETSGGVTEEEALATQIMIDNGNSVDYTA